MKKINTNWLALSLLLAVAIIPFRVNAVPLTLDGSWTVLDQNPMNNGDFFADNYTWNSASSVQFDITDLFVVSDLFEVYDNNVLVLTTNIVDDYVGLGEAASFHYTTDADVAWADAYFSKGSIVFGAGAHDITIKDTRIPTGYPDGTVAFRAFTVPEPLTLALLSVGLIGIGAARRK